jgi:hypothetical protein
MTKRAPHQADGDTEGRPRTVDDVRVLTLLAISAHSRSPSTKPDETPTRSTAGDDKGN